MAPRFYCHACNNTGWVDCYCGGDLCICDNNGEEPCPLCEDELDDDEFDHDDGALEDRARES